MQIQLPNPRKTFRASGQIVALAGTLPFLSISGVAGRVGRITRIHLTGFRLTAAQFLEIAMTKHSTANTGGTPVAVTRVPLNSVGPASLLNIQSWAAAAPTPGTLVGQMREDIVVGQAAAYAAGAFIDEVEMPFTNGELSTEYPTVRGTAEVFNLAFKVAPATPVTISFTIEYTEDGN